jgi:hypothetical protein
MRALSAARSKAEELGTDSLSGRQAFTDSLRLMSVSCAV